MIRDRVRELRRVPAAELLRNPANWRLHPPEQRAALRAALEEVGIAAAVIAREDEDGNLVLIDGHLRRDMIDQEIPVLILDVDEEEAARLLATLDPLAAMAEADLAALRSLLERLGGDEVDPLLERLREEAGVGPPTETGFEPVSAETQPRLDERNPVKCPGCGIEFVPTRPG